jgi:hypothetical protein
VIERVVGAVGARAGLDIDRLADARLAAEAVAVAAARVAPARSLALRAVPVDGGLHLVFGPFAPGEATAVRAAGELPGLGRVVDALVDDVSVLTGADGERLLLSFLAAR